MALQEQYSTLQAAGVDVVAITAEPGGEKAVRERLTEREVPALSFEVRSDPKHAFLTDTKFVAPKDIFVTLDHEWEVSGPYKMVQPALVVYDTAGKEIKGCTWSWKSMGFSEGDAMTRVPTEAWAGPTKQVLLVTMRPLMSDLVTAIAEKRAVKLASTHDEW